MSGELNGEACSSDSNSLSPAPSHYLYHGGGNQGGRREKYKHASISQSLTLVLSVHVGLKCVYAALLFHLPLAAGPLGAFVFLRCSPDLSSL